jgi:hypothetical protein
MRDESGGGGRVSGRVEGDGGNREVSPLVIFDACGDPGGASVEANYPEEGGSWGKHGFPHASEPQPREGA